MLVAILIDFGKPKNIVLKIKFKINTYLTRIEPKDYTMQTNRNKAFPQEFSDEEILKDIELNSNNLQKNLMYSPSGVASPIFFTSKIDLCYNELNKRNNERFLQQVKRLNDENERSGRINFRLNILTISLALISIILTIVTLLS